jgi:alkaline phosphatase
MHKNKKFILYPLLIIILTGNQFLAAQSLSLRGHSHNDYEQQTPFLLAYENRLGSVEVDIWVVDSLLLVAHEREDVSAENTIWEMYLSPIIDLFSKNGGKPWADSNDSFQLLVDLKSPAVPTLDFLAGLLSQYPNVFDRKVNPFAVIIVISGSRPNPEDYKNYPGYIMFDGNIGAEYTEDQLQRIPLFSSSFKDFSQWDGRGQLPEADKMLIKSIVNDIHKMGKKVRFWNAPDTENAWNQFLELGIDYINTDDPAKFSAFCSKK